MGIFDAIRNYTETATANVLKVYGGWADSYRYHIMTPTADIARASSGIVTTFVANQKDQVANNISAAAGYIDNVGEAVSSRATNAAKGVLSVGNNLNQSTQDYLSKIGSQATAGVTKGFSTMMSDTAMKVVIAGGTIYLLSQVVKSKKAQRWLS